MPLRRKSSASVPRVHRQHVYSQYAPCRVFGTYEAEIDPQFPITGWEHIFASDSFDDEGTPDYALATYDNWNIRTETLPDGRGGERVKTIGLAYEVVAPQRIRVKASAGALGRLRIGERMLYRYTVCGHEVFNISASHGIALRGNTFVNGWRNPPRDADPERRDVRLVHCDSSMTSATEPRGSYPN